MSYRRDKLLALTGVDAKPSTHNEIVDIFHEKMKHKMHGLCFSPYQEGQKPGDVLSEDQITRRIKIIAPHTKWVRSFSCTEGNELIPRIAKKHGLKTLVGAWLGKDEKINEQEIENLIQMAKEGYVDIAAVGNEVMYRGDLSEDKLLEYISRVKSELVDIPIGYVDAYYEFEFRERITEECDVILANCYPFWEGCSIEYSLPYMKDMYGRAKKAGNGKKVIITETGWPNQGAKLYGAQPSKFNALTYYLNAQAWSKEDDIEMFYFSSFDESWKVDSEGDVGPFWGLWNSDEKLKY